MLLVPAALNVHGNYTKTNSSSSLSFATERGKGEWEQSDYSVIECIYIIVSVY